MRRTGFLKTPYSYLLDNLNELPHILCEREAMLRPERVFNVEAGQDGVHNIYFQSRPVQQSLEKSTAQCVIEIGSGQGGFVLDNWKLLERFSTVVASDYEDPARKKTRELLHERGLQQIPVMQADIGEPEAFAEFLKTRGINPHDSIIYTFFIIQENRNLTAENLSDMLARYHEAFGKELVFAELFDIPWQDLVSQRFLTQAPVYILFHKLSRQVLLPIDVWNEAIAASPWLLTDFYPFGRPFGMSPAGKPQFWSAVFRLQSRAECLRQKGPPVPLEDPSYPPVETQIREIVSRAKWAVMGVDT